MKNTTFNALAAAGALAGGVFGGLELPKIMNARIDAYNENRSSKHHELYAFPIGRFGKGILAIGSAAAGALATAGIVSLASSRFGTRENWLVED